MDRVRFGRALGYGARQAVKTLVAAADAATADSPSSNPPSVPVGSSGAAKVRGATLVEREAPRPASPPAAANGAARAGAKTGPPTARKPANARDLRKGVGRGAKRFGEAVWGPVVRLSGVLWLEVTGVFFGVFALSAGMAVWRLHGDWHTTATNAAGHRSLMFALAMLLVFGYFCVSSFSRAKKRERGR
jgi:hypothetical protein